MDSGAKRKAVLDLKEIAINYYTPKKSNKFIQRSSLVNEEKLPLSYKSKQYKIAAESNSILRFRQHLRKFAISDCLLYS